MVDFNPYITFNGNCEEALAFYKKCFKGDIVFVQRYGDAPRDIPESHREKIMHSEFQAENMKFMACDNAPGQTFQYGSNITFNLTFDNKIEQDRVFYYLSEGGKVYIPLEETFWKSRFGLLTDKFGIHWMLNCDVGT